MDMSSLLGQTPVPGLLSPEQQGNAGSQGLMSLGAGLIKAGGPSEFKNNFGGVGDAIQGGLEAYNKSTTQALQAQYIKGQINKQTFDQMMALHQTIAQYRGADLPIPPELQAMADKAGIPPPPGGPAPAGPAPMPPAGPPAAGPAPAPPPGLLSPPQQGGPAPASPMPPRDPSSLAGVNVMPLGSGAPGSGAPGPAPMAFNDRIPPGGGMPPAGPPPGLLSPPAPQPVQPPAPMPQGGPSLIMKGLPVPDRYAIIGGGPAGKIVSDVTTKNLEATPEGKNARDPAVLDFETNKLAGAAGVKQYAALHAGLSGAGFTAANSKPYNDAAAAIIQDPKFFSGSGEELNLGYKRFLAAAGIDPGAALPQEAFRKVMAANILQQVNSLKAEAEAMGQNGGRIFGSQIAMMEKAAQNPSNTIAANRYLTELAARSGARTQHMADMADDYAQAHGGRLDAGFEKSLRKWMNDTPVFSQAELKDQSLVGNAGATAAPPKYIANDGKGGRKGSNDGTNWFDVK